jgi:hypothetical protein
MDTVLVTFTANDECGNSVTTQASLITSDTTVMVEGYEFAPMEQPGIIADQPLAHLDICSLVLLFPGRKRYFNTGAECQDDWMLCQRGRDRKRDSLTMYLSSVATRYSIKVGDEFVLLYDLELSREIRSIPK